MTTAEPRYYAGVGSRETPDDVLELMKEWGKLLAAQGWVLRSGGAPGADQAFELGSRLVAIPWEELSSETGQIFLPWSGFEGRSSAFSDPLTVYYDTPQSEAYGIASEFHPNWYGMRQGGRRLHARNVHQVYGPDVNRPAWSEFVVCWTPGGGGGGGTGQALRIARHRNIPIFDMGDPEQREGLEAFVTV